MFNSLSSFAAAVTSAPLKFCKHLVVLRPGAAKKNLRSISTVCSLSLIFYASAPLLLRCLPILPLGCPISLSVASLIWPSLDYLAIWTPQLSILSCRRPLDFIVLLDSCFLGLHFFRMLLDLGALLAFDCFSSRIWWLHINSLLHLHVVGYRRASSIYSVGASMLLVKIPFIYFK